MHTNEFHRMNMLWKNKAIHSLYLTLGLLYFAEGLVSVFVPIYLWQLGFSFSKILLFYFLHSAYFVFFAALFIPAFRYISDRMLIFLSIPSLILYFLGLPMMVEIPALFFILPAALSLNMLLFNTGYHIHFSSAADDGYLGRETGMQYVVLALMQMAAPFLGGVVIALLGFGQVFLVGSVLLFVSLIPLLVSKQGAIFSNMTFRSVAQYLYKNQNIRAYTISGIGYASETSIQRIIWPLFIFLSIGSIEQFGGLISLGLFASAVVAFTVGSLTDHGKRKRIIQWMTFILSSLWFLRPWFPAPAALAVNHIAWDTGDTALSTAWQSQYYEIAHHTRDASSFILSREVLYHAARVVFLPILIILSITVPLYIFFSVSFITAGLFTLLFLYANRAP